MEYLCSSLLDDHDQIYQENANSERFYMFYLSYATLHLSALRDRAFYWNEAYIDPNTNKLSKPNNDFDLHVTQLFDWQEQYIKDLETIKDRLIAWRINNISDRVGEDFKQYQDGSGGNAYWAFEWHDTINGLKWYQDTLSAGYFEDNAADRRRQKRRETLENYRNGMADTKNKTFQHEGQNIDSYAYHLAHEMAVASRWKYFCLPQGGAQTPWFGLSLGRAKDKVVFNYGLQDIDYRALKSLATLQFTVHDYLPAMEFTEKQFPQWRADNWDGFEDDLEFSGTSAHRSGTWTYDFAEKLYLIGGELKFIDRMPRSWNWVLD